ncbi:hypothetical protein QQG55_45245 [Brugia pahangi]
MICHPILVSSYTFAGLTLVSIVFDQELDDRYIAILIAEFSKAIIGYVAAINLHKIPPPIFVKYYTTAHLTTTKSSTTHLMVSMLTTVTITQGASRSILSNNLFAICLCFIAYVE